MSTSHQLIPDSFQQLTFSDQSMAELNKLNKIEQLQLIEQLSSVTMDQLVRGASHVGKLQREGKTFYRLRVGEFRIYCEIREDTLYSHYILHQHSLADFVFRFKLPFAEEQLVEQHQSFWKYLESLTHNDVHSE